MTREEALNGKKMKRPITIVYDWLYKDPFGAIRREYTAETYEDYHRVVSIFHKYEDEYKVISVTRKRGE